MKMIMKNAITIIFPTHHPQTHLGNVRVAISMIPIQQNLLIDIGVWWYTDHLHPQRHHHHYVQHRHINSVSINGLLFIFTFIKSFFFFFKRFIVWKIIYREDALYLLYSTLKKERLFSFFYFKRIISISIIIISINIIIWIGQEWLQNISSK